MKYILKLVIAAMCLFSQDAFAQSNKATTSIVRVIRMDDIAALSEKSPDALPPSSTGTLLSSEGHVFTSSKLAKPGERERDVEYLVLFPVYNQDGNVHAVRGYRALSQARSDEKKLLALKIDKVLLPDPIEVAPETPQSTLKIIDIGYPDAIGNNMNEYDRSKIHAMLQLLSLAAHAKGMSVISNEKQDQPQMMQYVTPQEAKGEVIHSTSQHGTKTHLQHNTKIDIGNEGSPLIAEGGNSLVGITTKVIEGANPYNTAQGASAVRAFAMENNIPLGVQLNLLPYIIAAAALLLVIIALLLVMRGRGKEAPAQAAKAGDEKVEHTAILESHTLFTLVADSGESYAVTSDMARRGTRIGRSPECGLKFSHPTVSGKHGLLCAENGRAAIADTDSSGGTYVNGEKLEPNKPKTLHRGDVLILGSCHVHVK